MASRTCTWSYVYTPQMTHMAIAFKSVTLITKTQAAISAFGSHAVLSSKCMNAVTTLGCHQAVPSAAPPLLTRTATQGSVIDQLPARECCTYLSRVVPTLHNCCLETLIEERSSSAPKKEKEEGGGGSEITHRLRKKPNVTRCLHVGNT